MGDTRENKTEPFEGKTQTELENYPTEVQRTRGRRQSWKRSAWKPVVKNRRKRIRNKSGEIRGGLASDEEEHWDITN